MTRTEAQLSATFGALADPTRRAILAQLTRGDATVGELAAPFALTPQAISKHIKVLERAQLVRRSRDAQARPCSLNPDTFTAAAQWLEQQRALWADRHDRLAEHLRDLQEPGSATQTDPERPRQTR
jgi:DNA-binding transcriptional ArsR family regulator